MKKLLGSLALSALLAAPAIAADIPMRPAPVRTPAAAPVAVSYVYNWTGCHIGINGGYGAGRLNYDDGVDSDSISSVSGPLAGGQVGCSYQAGMFVFGFEVDGQWANFKTDEVFADGPPVATVEIATNWFVTARGRLGFAMNNVLIYGTGGYAQVGLKVTIADDGTTPTATSTTSRGGWVGGGGVEVAFGSWSIRGEYLYLRAANQNITFGAFPTMRHNTETHIGRAALNYRFGGGPIASRY